MLFRTLLGALFVAALVFGLWHLSERQREGDLAMRAAIAERGDIGDGAAGVAESAAESAADSAGDAVAAATEAAGDALDSAGAAVGDAMDAASDVAADATDAAGDAMDAAGDAMADAADAVTDTAGAAADAVVNAAGEAMQQVGDGVETAMNAAGAATEEAQSFVERTAEAVGNAATGEGSTDVLDRLLGGMSYGEAREAMIAGGWTPRSIAAEERADARTETEAALLGAGFDELESCNASERPICRFEFVDGTERIAAVLTAGTGDDPDVIDAFLMSIER